MDILMLLIPLSVVLALLIAAVLWWSVQNGQFDDLDGPAHRILADDDSIAFTSERDLTAVKAPSAERP
ncbi:MAG TPA: cbb3-type cytochrome oxidase assembly protein CcoS [Casimicrobiaceae bacterium]|jgi:cbb3-type cytochrome oxidase maturation protein